MNTGVQLVVQLEQPQTRRKTHLFSRREPAEQRCEQPCSEGHIFFMNKVKFLRLVKFVWPEIVEQIQACRCYFWVFGVAFNYPLFKQLLHVVANRTGSHG